MVELFLYGLDPKRSLFLLPFVIIANLRPTSKEQPKLETKRLTAETHIFVKNKAIFVWFFVETPPTRVLTKKIQTDALSFHSERSSFC